MKEIFLVVAILLIIIVLLQSGKAEGGTLGSGVSSDLFTNRKERGSELFISRLTMALGAVFFVLTIVMDVI